MLPALASAQTTEDWLRTYDLSGHADSMSALVSDSSGNVYAASNSVDADGVTGRIVVIKCDKFGQLVWSTVFGMGSNVASARKIALDSQGNIVVCGSYTQGSNKEDALVAKFDGTGKQLWFVTYNDPGANGTDILNDLVLDSTDNIFLTGVTTRVGTGIDALTMKVSPAGSMVWRSRYDSGSQKDFSTKVSIDTAGYTYICDEGLDASPHVRAVKYDSTGNQRYDIPLSADSAHLGGFSVDGAGNLVALISGSTTQLVQYSTAGTKTWSTTIDTTGFSAHAVGLTKDSKGNFLAAINLAASGTGKLRIAQLTPAGVLGWVANIGTTAPDTVSLQTDSTNDLLAATQSGADHWQISKVYADGSNGYTNSVPSGDLAGFILDSSEGITLFGSQGVDGVMIRLLQLPIGVADSYATSKNTTLSVTAAAGVLSNDHSVQNAIAVLVTQPAHGTLTLAVDGGFTYVPATGYTGPDSFSYRAIKGDLASAITQVSLADQPVLSSFVVSPSTINGGSSATGTITLTDAAGSTGVVGKITCQSSVLHAPDSVTVASGSKTASFTITSSVVSSPAYGRPVSVTVGSVTKNCYVSVVPPPVLDTLTLSPTSILSGETTTATVTLKSNAGSPTVVSTSDDTSILTTPASVTVPTGKNNATLAIVAGTSLSSTVTRHVYATLGNVTKTATITITPALLLSIAPTSIKGGGNATGIATLGRTPTETQTVTVKANSAILTVPPKLSYSAGISDQAFEIDAAHVAATCTRTVSATWNGVTVSASITITP